MRSVLLPSTSISSWPLLFAGALETPGTNGHERVKSISPDGYSTQKEPLVTFPNVFASLRRGAIVGFSKPTTHWGYTRLWTKRFDPQRLVTWPRLPYLKTMISQGHQMPIIHSKLPSLRKCFLLWTVLQYLYRSNVVSLSFALFVGALYLSLALRERIFLHISCIKWPGQIPNSAQLEEPKESEWALRGRSVLHCSPICIIGVLYLSHEHPEISILKCQLLRPSTSPQGPPCSSACQDVQTQALCDKEPAFEVAAPPPPSSALDCVTRRFAMFFSESGCSGPSTLWQRTCTWSCSSSASFHRPWLLYVTTRFAMFCSVWGCSGPSTLW